MRFTLSLTAALLMSTAAVAEDILVRAPITSALIYSPGADIVRTARVSIPEGEHRLLFVMPDAPYSARVQVTGPDGLLIGIPQRRENVPVAEGLLDTAEQSAARAAVDVAEAVMVEAQDALATADAELQSLGTQLAYLNALSRGGQDGVTMPDDPAQVTQFLATLGSEMARVLAEQQTAQIARRDLYDAFEERQRDLRAALAALARTQPYRTEETAMSVTVTADTAMEAELTLAYPSADLGWQPFYELHLASDTGALRLDRLISVYSEGSAVWTDVDVQFSTAQPDRRREPSQLSPSAARIVEPEPRAEPSQSPGVGLMSLEVGGRAIAQPVVAAEDAAATVIDYGLSLAYDYGRPVTIGPDGRATLPFDSLTFDAETEAHAVPRRDETAFLMARFENDSGEPILPGAATYYRDGALIGDGFLQALIPAGAETEMAFGPLDHLRLEWIDRSLAEGDSGIFVTSNTQARSLAFGVENTSGEPASVRLYYATPFAEQEDLEFELTLSPSPDIRDVDDLRGIHVWELEIGPGSTELVEMDVEFSWPEGQILTWRP